jgi:hypothetical protein
MRIEATLTRDDLAKTLNDLCPLHISIGKEGRLIFSGPRRVELVPDAGLRMTVDAKIEWPVLGLLLPVTIRTMTLLMSPSVLEEAGAPALAFKLHLSQADIALVPAVLDASIVHRVNQELEAKPPLIWRFTRTLSHVFALPAALASAEAIDVRAASGYVKTTSEALVFVVSFQTSVNPREGSPEMQACAPA